MFMISLQWVKKMMMITRAEVHFKKKLSSSNFYRVRFDKRYFSLFVIRKKLSIIRPIGLFSQELEYQRAEKNASLQKINSSLFFLSPKNQNKLWLGLDQRVVYIYLIFSPGLCSPVTTTSWSSDLDLVLATGCGLPNHDSDVPPRHWGDCDPEEVMVDAEDVVPPADCWMVEVEEKADTEALEEEVSTLLLCSSSHCTSSWSNMELSSVTACLRSGGRLWRRRSWLALALVLWSPRNTIKSYTGIQETKTLFLLHIIPNIHYF